MRIKLEEALSLVKNRIEVKKPEVITLFEGFGRILAEDLRADVDYPPFNRSPYDGYALKAEDTNNDVCFRVIGKSYAGEPAGVIVSNNETVRIMTGGVIPEGADCIVPQEDVSEENGAVRVGSKYKPYDNYIKQGEDFKKGEIILKKGNVINSATSALAFTAGKDKVCVYPKLKAAVITTGNELVGSGEILEKGKIYDSNRIYLMMKLKELGITSEICLTVGDDQEALEDVIMDACKKVDFIITTGGVSVGEKDLIPKVIEGIKAETVFHGVSVKPGMPTLFAVAENGVPILCLSGNPFAAAVGFELIGRQLIVSLTGNENYILKRKEAVIVKGFTPKSSMRRFVKAIEKGGKVYIPKAQGNGSLKSSVECNCYIDVPSGSSEFKIGDKVVIVYV